MTDAKTLGITESVCPRCRRIVPAKITSDGRDVYFQKFCPAHGDSRVLVRRDLEDYLAALRYVKPAWVPREYRGRSDLPCPEGCGMCGRHEQHVCMPIIEITSRCDLSCPICLVDAGRPWDMGLDEFRRILDGLIRAERQIDVLNISGGEPLVHPELVALLDEAIARPEIVRVSISTNGLRLLERPDLLDALGQRKVVVSLQFDGFDDRVYVSLRGRPLLAQKRAILDRLAEADLSTSLTVTAAGGVNEDQFGPILEYFFAHRHVVSMMVQPAAFVGRGRALAGRTARLMIPDVVELLARAGQPRVAVADFVPLPCAHPLCLKLAYYLALDNGSTLSIRQLVDVPRLLDSLANRTIFGLDPEEHQNLKDLVYDLWSAPAGSVPEGDAVMKTLRGILDSLTTGCGCFDPRQAFLLAERRIKSIFIHAFQDADTFDLARVRRCCHAYPQPDGTLVPVCVNNVLRRNVPGPVGARAD
jgi:7,8-dihydro-6-hydroxymethylpterin dimethyltransferase